MYARTNIHPSPSASPQPDTVKTERTPTESPEPATPVSEPSPEEEEKKEIILSEPEYPSVFPVTCPHAVSEVPETDAEKEAEPKTPEVPFPEEKNSTCKTEPKPNIYEGKFSSEDILLGSLILLLLNERADDILIVILGLLLLPSPLF